MLLRLPYSYGIDAAERVEIGPYECSKGKFDNGSIDLVRHTKQYVWLEVDQAGLDSLTGDADYYSNPKGFEPDYRQLCRSAAKALVILKSAGGDKSREHPTIIPEMLVLSNC